MILLIVSNKTFFNRYIYSILFTIVDNIKIKFRTCKESDVDEIQQIASEFSFRQNRGSAQVGYLISDTSKEKIALLIRQRISLVAVSEETQEILGYMFLMEGGTEPFNNFFTKEHINDLGNDPIFNTELLFVDKIVVKKGHGGNGIGSKLFEAIFNKYPKSNFCSYTNIKPVRNIPSIKLHEKVGFNCIKSRPFTDGETDFICDFHVRWRSNNT